MCAEKTKKYRVIGWAIDSETGSKSVVDIWEIDKDLSSRTSQRRTCRQLGRAVMEVLDTSIVHHAQVENVETGN